MENIQRNCYFRFEWKNNIFAYNVRQSEKEQSMNFNRLEKMERKRKQIINLIILQQQYVYRNQNVASSI